MKRLFLISLIIIGGISLQAQTITATMKSSSRLFSTKDDLTSVILIIPADSVVAVLDSDSTYLHVVYEDNEGYIFNRHVLINNSISDRQKIIQSQPSIEEPVQGQQDNRFTYLENKYGTTMATKLALGKIWKGMNSDMVKDSWGIAEKINRVISGNIIKEEWIFRNTWLYFENNTLVEWGPVKK